VTGVISELADLSGLAAAPVDMAFVDGKVYVATGDRVLALDPDTGELHMDLGIPWPDEVAAVSKLAAAGNDLAVAAALEGGGSRLYRLAGDKLTAAGDHAHEITALQAIGSYLWAGNDQGHILVVADGFLLQHATSEAAVVSFGANGNTIYAGTGDDGKIFRRVSGWAQSADMGWTAAKALASCNGWIYAGGDGTGGQYLWYEAAPGSWVQALELADVTAVNDLAVVQQGVTQQLFAATARDGNSSDLVRIEMAEDGELVLPAEWFAPGYCRQYGFEVLR